MQTITSKNTRPASATGRLTEAVRRRIAAQQAAPQQETAGTTSAATQKRRLLDAVKRRIQQTQKSAAQRLRVAAAEYQRKALLRRSWGGSPGAGWDSRGTVSHVFSWHGTAVNLL